jgi:hypothetical protein
MTSLGLTAVARRRVAERWRVPMYRAALLLAASSGLSAVLGVVFWLGAARLFPPRALGLSSTALSSMMLIAGIAQSTS